LLEINVNKEEDTDKQDQFVYGLGGLLVFFFVGPNNNQEEDHCQVCKTNQETLDQREAVEINNSCRIDHPLE